MENKHERPKSNDLLSLIIRDEMEKWTSSDNTRILCIPSQHYRDFNDFVPRLRITAGVVDMWFVDCMHFD